MVTETALFGFQREAGFPGILQHHRQPFVLEGAREHYHVVPVDEAGLPLESREDDARPGRDVGGTSHCLLALPLRHSLRETMTLLRTLIVCEPFIAPPK